MPPSNWPRIVKTKKMLQLLQMLFSIFFLSGHYNCHGLVFQISKMSTVSQGFKSIVSSNTRSYSDSVLLGIRHQLFEILSISAKIFIVFIYSFFSCMSCLGMPRVAKIMVEYICDQLVMVVLNLTLVLCFLHVALKYRLKSCHVSFCM